MMADFDFTDNEIKDELRKLGYVNVPSTRLGEFRRDLEALIHSERSSETGRDTGSETNSWTDQSDRYVLPHDRQVESTYIGAPSTTRLPLHLSSVGNVPDVESFHYHRPGNSALVGAGDGAKAAGAGSRLNSGVVAGAGNRPSAGVTTGAGNRPIKRKVLRKGRDGLVEISESTTGSEADDMSYIEDRLGALSARTLNDEDERGRVSPLQRAGGAGRRTTANSVERPGSRLDRSRLVESSAAATDTSRDSSRSGAESVRRGAESRASVIHSMTSDPHTRGWTRSDPVSCYQKYRTGWETQRAPGERAHKDLRWAVRERMVYHDPIVEKRQHSYRPNSYVVPTDKQRKTLRWQIREDLAQGIVRPSSAALQLY